MTIDFVKMHAHGDDFVVVDRRGKLDPITSDLARRLGDRNRGIGFNQLAVVLDCDDAAARVRFWNPDGTVLDTCGSATRGVADLLMREANASSIVLKTNRGLLTCVRGADQRVSVDMGTPLVGWQDIPLAEAVDTIALPLPGNPAACSMGNPHCTFFVDDLAAVDVAAIGPGIETHPLFRNKTNVHFVQILGRTRIRLRIWERGGGIPLGSGSCCCGAVVGGIRRGLLDDTVDVECDGGMVNVQWDGAGGVVLTGLVEPVFRGTIADHFLHESVRGGGYAAR
ncbi:diaminopimelate epimerase [Burkholderia sp. Ac-20353]|uniref:diaminopimelate epimerase n=1 Tax=Burkholderia sp. Ac-20353 TaxID=2703894 RepID=UPI00197CB4D6|nr:diaminopimelate epimerase [Burkholderia sp. Ac-20353]MBN3787917.1 diaminopimelate epimerase [Burkholderia sp. Ac-20353]